MRVCAPAVLLVITPLLVGAQSRARPLAPPRAQPVVVASKPFAESYVLGEMFAQVLERGGWTVERRLGLGATEIAFGALRAGAVDVYPEYTGTGLVAILGEQPLADATRVFTRVAEEFPARYGVRWLAPLGFQNTYAIAVRRGTADSLGLRTLSDLARAAPGLRAGLSPDFIGRADGLVGLRRAYGGLAFAQERALLQAVKYTALASGAVDVVDGYSTDGAIARYRLVVLEDDRRFFPAYQAAALVGRRLYEDDPAAVVALGALAGRLSEAAMRRYNERVEIGGEPVAVVARQALADVGLGDSTMPAGTATASGRPGLLRDLWSRRGQTLRQTGRHLLLTVLGLGGAVLVGVPLGLGLARARPGAAEGTIRAVGVLQTIPSLALLAFMIPLLGIGVRPALAALFLYALYPVVRNTYSGVQAADPVAAAAARALGMTDAQVLRYVRLPLGLPVIMAGVRTAAVITVGAATLAAFVGAGGLGDPIVTGLALSDTRLILSGAVPAALLALAVDAVLGAVERKVRPVT